MSVIDRVGGWPTVLAQLTSRADLGADQTRGAMESILAGEATSAQIAAFLVALRSKGETAEELGGMLDAVLAASGRIELPKEVASRAIDIVGTGGDASHSVNVSTMAALVVAGAGVPVCKHGNRASSSKCGTADVLEQLGVVLEQSGEGVARCVAEAGMGFAFAPVFHPAFRHAGPTRKELGIPTSFNLLGPMANPAELSFMVVGVGQAKFAAVMANTLLRRGVTRAWVVHGHGGLDELSLSGPNHVLDVHEGSVREMVVDANDLGLEVAGLDAIRGGAPEDNARIVRETLDGKTGAIRDIVVLNAAAGLVVSGVADSMAQGVASACESIDSGKARSVLEALVRVSSSVAR
jgi:anthranilate phosphoribosyltransferase